MAESDMACSPMSLICTPAVTPRNTTVSTAATRGCCGADVPASAPGSMPVVIGPAVASPLVLQLQIHGAPTAVIAVEVAGRNIRLVGEVAGVQLQSPVPVHLVAGHHVQQSKGGYLFSGVVALIHRGAGVTGPGRDSKPTGAGELELMAEPQRGLMLWNEGCADSLPGSNVLARMVVGIGQFEGGVLSEIEITLQLHTLVVAFACLGLDIGRVRDQCVLLFHVKVGDGDGAIQPGGLQLQARFDLAGFVGQVSVAVTVDARHGLEGFRVADIGRNAVIADI